MYKKGRDKHGGSFRLSVRPCLNDIIIGSSEPCPYIILSFYFFDSFAIAFLSFSNIFFT